MEKLIRSLLACSLLWGIHTAQAVEVKKCDADTPDKGETLFALKTYYQGAVRVFLVDTMGEPACCSTSLLVYLPKKDAELAGEQECFWVTSAENLGFMNIEFEKIKSQYNPREGLLLTFPYSLYSDGGDGVQLTGQILLNLDKETVTAIK